MSSTPPSLARTPTDAHAAGVPSGRGASGWQTRWGLRILWANLVAQIMIVVTGGAVRLTGSGLGCSAWPECEPGSFTPVWHEATSLHPYIEFGNRTLTGVVGLTALGAALVLFTRRDRVRSLRLLALVPLVGVAVQAVVGGISVLVELHPAVVGMHLLISMVLVWVSAVLIVRYREGDGRPVPVVGPPWPAIGRVLVGVLVLVLALGVVVTGAGPHSGDADAPYRFALDPALVARWHALSVWLFVGLLAVLIAGVSRRPAPARTRRLLLVLLAVTLAQGAIGYVQYFSGLPEVLVGAHMLGAGLLTAATAWAVLGLRERR